MVQFGMPQNQGSFEPLWEKNRLSANDPIADIEPVGMVAEGFD